MTALSYWEVADILAAAPHGTHVMLAQLMYAKVGDARWSCVGHIGRSVTTSDMTVLLRLDEPEEVVLF